MSVMAAEERRLSTKPDQRSCMHSRPKIAFAALAAKQLDSGTEMFLDEKLMELQIPIVWRENDALSSPLCC